MHAFSTLSGPVLVVDDDPEVLDAYGMMLSATGLKVRQARDVAEALAHVAKEEIPVCLVDLHLGEANGIDLCVELRAANPAIRTLIITAYPAYESAVLALKVGIADYLSKAESPEAIIARVHAALEAHAEELRKQAIQETHGADIQLCCGCADLKGTFEGLSRLRQMFRVRISQDCEHLARSLDPMTRLIVLCQSCHWPKELPGDARAQLTPMLEASPQARILLANCTLDEEAQQQLLEWGVRGFLPPEASLEVLQDAVDVLLRDHYWISRSLTAKLLSRLLPPRENISSQSLANPLSPRELEILKALSEGLSNQEIGERCFISESTVKIHVHRIFRKLGVKSRTQALLRAMELRLY